MTCDCKTELEAKLTERFKAASPDSRDHKVTLEGYGFGIRDNTMVLQPYMNYKAFAFTPLKKGGEKPKKTIGNMVFTFCPFCGVRL